MPSDLKLAAQALVDKLDAIDEPVTGVFAFAAAHGYKYTGPDYAKELVNLRAALSHEAQSRDEVVELREALGRVIVEAEAIGPVPTHDTYGDRRRLMLGMVKMQHEAREALSKSEQNP